MVALHRSIAALRSCAASRAAASTTVRNYEYVIDHMGAVHLDNDRARTPATAYRDPKFLDDLYRGLRRGKGGAWAQRCAGELNYLRADSGDAVADASGVIVVFHGLLDAELRWAGTFAERFDPRRLGVSESGRLYHALDGRLGPWGLLGSHIAHGLSADL
eukprot:CAMPEP_0119282996 /NCGR_PEP_ID=MMETSP1329-20130426/27669_1 /TAXON_ID=114041 /ORGANISM="Genus nov. species nov., Strain RCC1024" /LENGTH=159 /DNA_ID=CAMNT_0007283661 /DNA_START=148 /DNA_END=624 /DNA_ORIENTATION=+